MASEAFDERAEISPKSPSSACPESEEASGANHEADVDGKVSSLSHVLRDNPMHVRVSPSSEAICCFVGKERPWRKARDIK